MTKQEQIVEAVVAAMKTLRKDALVPNAPPELNLRYQTTPRTVTRALSEVRADQYPVIFVTDPTIQERHQLADVSQATLTLFVSGALYDYNDAAVQEVRKLAGDVRSAIVYNSKWNGLALRTRLLRIEGNTEIEEPSASFTIALEIDYVEHQDTPQGPPTYSPKPVDASDLTRLQVIQNALHNALLNLPDVVTVQRATLWPVPYEQISRRECPGIWYFPQNHTLDYKASQQAMKTLTVSLQILDVETDLELFYDQGERWAAQFVMLMGRFADLEGRVLTVDVQTVRTSRSEYPLVVVDAEIQVKFYESFLTS